jgi:hypothetical protein
VILLADGCVVTCPIPLPAVNSNNGEDSSASGSSQTLSIPEAAIAVAAGEQHRCGRSTSCNLDLTCVQVNFACQRQVVSKRDHVSWPLQPCSDQRWGPLCLGQQLERPAWLRHWRCLPAAAACRAAAHTAGASPATQRRAGASSLLIL